MMAIGDVVNAVAIIFEMHGQVLLHTQVSKKNYRGEKSTVKSNLQEENDKLM